MKLWLSISALLVAGVLFALGFLAGAGTRPRGGPHGPPFFPENRSDNLQSFFNSDKVISELGVDKEQQEKIDNLFKMHSSRVNECRKGMRNLAEELQAGINSILTSEQKEGLARIQDEYRRREAESYTTQKMARLRLAVTDLTPEQEKAISPIVLDYKLRQTEIFKTSSRDDQASLQGVLRQLQEERDAKILQLLADPQKEKYRKSQDTERRLWGERHRQRDKDKKEPGAAQTP